MIHGRLAVIGNSHAHAFTDSPIAKYGLGANSNDQVSSFSLGPLSAKMLAHEKRGVFERTLKSLDPENDTVLLSFGEADCRWYLPSTYSLEDIQASIQEETTPTCVLDSMEYVRAAYLRIRELGFEAIVWGGHPSTKIPATEDPNMPAAGSPELRRALAHYWSISTLEIARELEIQYLYLFADLPSNQFPSEDQFVDQIHLDPKWLRSEMRAHLRGLDKSAARRLEIDESEPKADYVNRIRAYVSDKKMRLRLKQQPASPGNAQKQFNSPKLDDD